MKSLQFYAPIKPMVVTQPWGNPNRSYKQFGFSQHNGTDINVGRTGSIDYQTKFQVYCPSDGFTVHLVRNYPQGGGNEMWLISDEKLQIGDKECYAYMVFAHADKILVPVGYKPKLGELIMVANNTGFSTGPHTHWGLYRVDYDGKQVRYLDQNEANGSYDPAQFLQGGYAIDQATLPTLINSNWRYFNYYINR